MTKKYDTPPTPPTIANFIPRDKSWAIRMAILDIRFGKDTILGHLARNTEEFPTDLKYLLNACLAFMKPDMPVDVGESATLLRCMQFLAWTKGQEKQFIKRGTLLERTITSDKTIISLPPEELLKLDNETTQWATAACLCRPDEPKVKDASYKLNLTYEALAEWKECEQTGMIWNLRQDPTLRRQAEAFARMIQGGKMEFSPVHSEDYCFARAFGIIGEVEGQKLFPSLVGHESNRLDEMAKMLQEARMGRPVTSRDHRVVQAIAMYAKSRKMATTFSRPECVAKSWPLFWEFLSNAPRL